MTFDDGTDKKVATSLCCVNHLNAKDLVHRICWLAEELRRQLVYGNMFVLFTAVLYSAGSRGVEQHSLGG